MAIAELPAITKLTEDLIADVKQSYGVTVDIGSPTKADLEIFHDYEPITDPNWVDFAVGNTAFALQKYPPFLIQQLGLSTIKLASYLKRHSSSVEGHTNPYSVGGSAIYDSRTIYSRIDNSNLTIHHEIQHFFQFFLSYRFYNLKDEWCGINRRYGLSYVSFSGMFDENRDMRRPNGFTYKYGQSDLAEDISTVAEYLFGNPNLLGYLCSQDQALREKRDLLIEALAAVSEGAMREEWSEAVKNGRQVDFYCFWDTRPYSVRYKPTVERGGGLEGRTIEPKSIQPICAPLFRHGMLPSILEQAELTNSPISIDLFEETFLRRPLRKSLDNIILSV